MGRIKRETFEKIEKRKLGGRWRTLRPGASSKKLGLKTEITFVVRVWQTKPAMGFNNLRDLDLY